jgi:asparagine synthase (glutamine-hydrolysing)
MCGITGFLNIDGQKASLDTIDTMTRTLIHRGPDAQGIFLEGPLALGHTRLSIIDLATGDQPMHSDDGRLSLVFNGEIFNYRELRKELEEHGGRPFRTSSDTEVILRLYEAYGPNMTSKLNGQWAIALWDRAVNQLFLSRDRVGVRPLHYAHFGGTFAFASEIKSLFRHPKSRRELNPSAFSDILTFWAPLPGETAFCGVKELPPGHSLVVNERGQEISLKKHWEWLYPPKTSHPPLNMDHPDAYGAELLGRLRDAVRVRLRADVPVGAYLSGGVDSSLITSLASEAVREMGGEPLTTFSLSFKDRAYDESSYQMTLAKELGTKHHVIHCRNRDIGDSFEDVVWHGERPLLRTAPSPMLLLSRLVHEQGYKVVLTGEGADEVFGGYDIFRESSVRRFLARHPTLSFAREGLVRALYPYMPELTSQPSGFLNNFFLEGASDLGDPFYALRPRMRLTQSLRGLLSDDFRSQMPNEGSAARWAGHLPRGFDLWHPLDQAQHLEGTILMPGYILSSQGDRMAMAHGVEGRFPFLDYRVMEFASRLPPYMRLFGLKEKWLLKKVAARLVPMTIVSRPKQPYRAPDVPSLLAGSRKSGEPLLDLLSPGRVKKNGVFSPRAVASLVNRLKNNRHPPSTRDGMALSFLLSVQILHERFIA